MNLFRKLEQINNKLLPHTPDIYREENQFYVDELIGFINNPKTNNVALMGDYGTGKSSILEQLKDELGYQKCSLRHCDFIKTVSFLSFRTSIFRGELRSENEAPNMKTEASNDDDNASEHKSTSKSKSIKSLIQSEFIRQLFYSVSPNKLRGSHYSRVGRASPTLLKFIIIAVYAILLAFISNSMFQHINGYFDMLLTFIFVMLIYITVYLTIIGVADYLYSHPLKAFGVNGIEVALKDNDNDFEQLLDEIIYFFNRTKCEVLIIEDIDRFNDVEIYEDLRDLNVILNSARAGLKKKITFIYAMRPSLLPAISDRAKLFDAVIPVVPFVSNESSYGYTKQIIFNAVRDLETSQKEKDDIADKISRLVSGLTSDARAIKEIANAISGRVYVFCGEGKAKLYRSNFLYVATMAVIQEVSPSMYAALCNGLDNELDSCYSECLMIKQRKIDYAKLNYQYKKDSKELRIEVSRELMSKLRKEVKSAIYCFKIDESQGELFGDSDAVRIVDRILSGEILFFYGSSFLNINNRSMQNGVVVCNMEYIEQLSDVGKQLVEIEKNDINYYGHLYDEATKRSVWSYLDEAPSRNWGGAIEAIVRNELLPDDYRLYISPVETTDKLFKVIRYRRMYMQPRTIADYNLSLSDDEVNELILAATDAELSSPAVLNYSIVKYIFARLGDGRCAYCVKLLIESKDGKDLEYLMNFYMSFLNNYADEIASDFDATINSGRLFDGAISDDVAPYYNFTKYMFANYSGSMSMMLNGVRIANSVIREMCRLFWLKNIPEDDKVRTSGAVELIGGISIQKASANGLGNKLARLFKMSGTAIDDLSKFDARTDIDEVVELWCFRLTVENLNFVNPGVLTNVLATGLVNNDDMKFILQNGSRLQRSVVMARVYAIWSVNKSMLDNELARCAVEVLRNDDAYQTLNSAFIVSLLEQYASADDMQIILSKYINDLADADVLRVVAKTQYRRVVELRGSYVRVPAHDGCQAILDRLKTMGYVNKYKDMGNGKIHVVPAKKQK